MENFKVQWDGPEGPVTSAVSYDAGSAEGRKLSLEAEGRTGVVIIAAPIFGERGVNGGKAQR